MTAHETSRSVRVEGTRNLPPPPEAGTPHHGHHQDQDPVKVAITVTVNVDVDAWTETYGVNRADVRTDVREHVTNSIMEQLRELDVLSRGDADGI